MLIYNWDYNINLFENKGKKILSYFICIFSYWMFIFMAQIAKSIFFKYLIIQLLIFKIHFNYNFNNYCLNNILNYCCPFKKCMMIMF